MGHIRTLETVLYIEVVLNSEVIAQWSLSIKTQSDFGRGYP